MVTQPAEQTIFERVGGAPTFQALVNEFYARVEQDAPLRALFPDDMEPGKGWQFLFLQQLFGGDAEYSALRGHPRLRMRHMGLAIDRDMKERWLGHMLAAVDAVGIIEPMRTEMIVYFARAAEHMINDQG